MKQEEEVKQRDDPYQKLLMHPGELLNNIKQIHLSLYIDFEIS